MRSTDILSAVACAAIITIASCEKVIDIDLHEAAPQIVIEGNLTNKMELFEVRITRSVPFDHDNSYPPVTGATVSLQDDTGWKEDLHETAPGVYQTAASLTGTPGRTYTLLVTAEGQEYRASSTMPQPVTLDTLLPENLTFGNEVKKVIKPEYRDPLGFGNHYYFLERINGIWNKKIFVFDDRLNDGGISTRPLLDPDADIASGDTVTVVMHCIDKDIYRYFVALAGLQNNTTTPANPPSNISNGALGYFSAHTVSRKSIIMP